VGFTLLKMKNEIEDTDDTHYLIIIISDGEENASKEYDYDRIGSLIRRLQDTKRWTFVYIGANQDLSKLSNKMKIPSGNVSSLKMDKRSYRKSYTILSNLTSRHLHSTYVGDRIKSFFDDDDDDGAPPGGRLLH